MMSRLQLQSLAAKIASFLYGTLSFAMWGAIAIVEGRYVKKPLAIFWPGVEEERSRFWDLSKCPHPGFYHAFEDLNSGFINPGFRLHYLTDNVPARGQATKKTRNLVVFIHGFPDTSILWLEAMAQLEPTPSSTTLVAIDLPGYGGSQGLPRYGPNDILDILVEGICNLREKYLEDGPESRVIIVSHDWGAFLGYRLATRAPGIADHFVLLNTMFVEIAKENMESHVSNANRLFRLWFNQPRNIQPLLAAASAIGPVVRQFIKSSYIFQFNLPALIVRRFGSLGNVWFLRKVNLMRLRLDKGVSSISNPSLKVLPGLTHGMAESLGPNELACKTTIGDGDGRAYPSSVHERAASVNTAFFENVRLYREGLAFQPWIPLNHTRARLEQIPSKKKGKENGSRNTNVFSNTFQTPATVLWGMGDAALSYDVVASGIEKCMTPNSQIITMPHVGHWVPADPRGVALLVKIIEWTLQNGEARDASGQAHKESLRSTLEAKAPRHVEWNMIVEK